MSDYVSSLLAESWFDLTEEIDQLREDWYGDLCEQFEPNDPDFSEAVRSLTKTYRFWKTSRSFTPTAYEALRMKYDSALQAYFTLYEEHMALLEQQASTLPPVRAAPIVTVMASDMQKAPSTAA